MEGRSYEALIAECGLTHREAEVYGMLVRGASRRSIGECLSISENTVKTHVRHIYAKADALLWSASAGMQKKEDS